MLEAFCSTLRNALPAHSLDRGLVGTSIRSHVVPLQAYLVITSILGKGPRYVVLDSLQMQHHKDARVQATTEANWLELWHRRQSGCAAQAVYGESVRSHCSLLADEKTASILPALAMPVPAESAWLPVEMYLPDFADSRGHLIMPAVRAALRACLEANDILAPQLHWSTELQRLDSRTNNRVALLLSGIGDLVAGRGMRASEIHSLRWADSIVRAVQGELLNTSREMARSNDTLPSLLQSDPSNIWHNFEQQHSWSSRWHQTLQAEAVRHRNLLVLSPYSVLPRGSKCSADFTDLLPVLEHADAISFCHSAHICELERDRVQPVSPARLGGGHAWKPARAHCSRGLNCMDSACFSRPLVSIETNAGPSRLTSVFRAGILGCHEEPANQSQQLVVANPQGVGCDLTFQYKQYKQ